VARPVGIVPRVAVIHNRSHMPHHRSAHTLTFGVVLLVLLTSIGQGDPVKTRRTLWTDDQVAAMRARGGDVDPGPYAALDDEQLWELMPPTTIPRKAAVDQFNRCPVHGILSTIYAWKRDYIHHPYQLQCPIGDEWYPNDEYPDDGGGYVGDDGRTYHFIRFYAHWAYLDAVCDGALPQLSTAYLHTGNRDWAHKAAVLLTRVAQQMPNNTDKADRCYGGTYGHWQGLITDYVWESIRLTNHAEAYERIFDAIDDDAELAAFIQTKIPALDTGPKIRAYIEDNLLRVGGRAIIDETLDGNPGFPQYSGLTIAAVLDDDASSKHPDSRDLVEWLYYGWGDARFMLNNFLHRDGGGMESPAYSRILIELMLAAERMETYRTSSEIDWPLDRYPNMWAYPKVRAMFDFNIAIHVQNRFLPEIGDSGYGWYNHAERPSTNVAWKERHDNAYDFAYERYQDPRYARVVVGDDDVLQSTRSLDQSQVQRRIDDAHQVGDLFKHNTALLDGYGMALLYGGNDANQRTLWCYYGDGRVHHHTDPLHLGLFAFNRRLLSDLGYPLQLAAPYRSWAAHIWTHNTVVVDGNYPFTPGNWGITHTPHGRVQRMHQWDGVQLIEIALPMDKVNQFDGAPNIDTYKRTLAMLDVGTDQFYAIDIFDVRGGREHHLSYHFQPGDVQIDGAELQARPGTLAGEDVAYAGQMMSLKGYEHYYDPRSCMTNVRRGATGDRYATTWTHPDADDVHLRLTHLAQPGDEAILTDGRPPADPDKYTLVFDLLRREGDAPLASRFVTIIEPFADEPVIRLVQRLPVEGNATALRIETAAGVDVVIVGEDGTVKRVASENIVTNAQAAIVRRHDGDTALMMSGGTQLRAGDASIRQSSLRARTSILAVDREANQIVVQSPRGQSWGGRWIHIGDDHRSTYRVIAEQRDDNRVRLTLDTTSLLAQGVVRGVRDNVVLNDVQMPLGGLMDGKVVALSLSGATIECGGHTRAIDNVEYGNYYRKRDNWNVHLQGNTPAARLGEMFPQGAIFSIFDYGVGDPVNVVAEASN
jgi:hypothetical protein